MEKAADLLKSITGMKKVKHKKKYFNFVFTSILKT